MFAEVKHFQWTDVVDDNVAPDFPTLLEMHVTSPGYAAVLRFEVAVTTIEELTQRLNFQSCISGHGQVVVAEFDRHRIESFLRSAVGQVSAETWEELEIALGRFGRSEFNMAGAYWSPDPWEAPGT
ncbi:Imm8 family immunity protein [Arthrobacter sp. ISL-65]|uniref:Imm8 family immunity protein n=1 Tax=Arthrobacter sp. ISL-65 TaxID=2819112 RepID=UPI001BE8B7BF|nr:Imm8 family immunity protein [Arthrobacter sp. ISL-65]MBT2550099.1 hypothetical protein [Arthrobacter sp. ISL-65]